MKNRLRAFFLKAVAWRRARSGATAIEYALIAAGITLAIVATVFALGTDVFVMLYQRLVDAFEQARG